ncbi:cell wall-active antibiotics response protein [Alkalibacter mobilis]|uniref:cell wall-active antibiotics response protein n=1 Tax=Alkalibacter mobilis TaxID=2787712 RepID=UPI00189EE5DA|nr:cell wall-active antibiotics response protein [Alkalibacter mobilis]MBF7097638.1 cell wall-active antibiotics response protein [Alkalibacter mobilis]
MKRNFGNILAGLLILIIGMALLLNNLGITDFNMAYLIFTYWPIFIIIAGLSLLINHGSKGEVLSGILILSLGTLILLRNLGFVDINISTIFNLIWPMILILIGFAVLTGKKSSGKSNFAFMGSIERLKDPWKVEEGGYFAFMGGIELDFRVADIPEGTTTLDLNAFMGGIEVTVPRNITVVCDGMAVLGGIELLGKSTGGIIANTNSSQNPETGNKKLVFHCRAIMGGIEVKASD